MEFTYTAKSHEGEIKQGKIDAQTEKQAVNSLQKEGLFVLEMTTSNTSITKSFSFLKLKKKVSLKDKIIFTNQLAMMVKGGLPLVEALKALEEQTENEVFRKAIISIIKDVQGGLSLSKAIAKYPKIFPKLYVSVVVSGETSGKLDEVLARLSDQLQKDYDLISKVKSAVSYPVVVVVALVSVVILMLVFVVPKLKDIFTEMGVALPLPTRILLGLSDAVVKYWYIVLVLVIGIYLLIRLLMKKPSGQYAWDSFKVKAPLFGPLAKKIYMARFTRTMATLVTAGLPMLQIINTVKEVVGNAVYQRAFENIAKEVETGITLSMSIKKQKIFPPMIYHMISVGEKSGKVDEILNHLANFYDKEVEQSTSSMASLIEPILILLIGAGIGAAIAAVIMPIYSLVNVI